MRNENGFTLIEVAIALVILMFGLTGLLGMSTHAIRSANDNDRWVQARIVAANNLSQLATQPLETLQLQFDAASSGAVSEYHAGVTYTATWQMERLGSQTDPMRLTVTVDYPGALAPVRVSTVKSFFL